jgi:hypothetical protein
MKNDPTLHAALTAITVAGVAILVACAPGTGQQVGKVATAGAPIALAVVNDLCRELPGGERDWVTLACAAEGVANGVVNVKMRRPEWLARRGACRPSAYDAGMPGL